MELIIKFTGDESGAAVVEYAFLLAFIVIGVAASISSFFSVVARLFRDPFPTE